MSLSSLFSKKENNNLVAVFDIASSSVGGSLTFLSKGGAPRIVYTTREPIVLLEDIDADQLLSLTMKCLSVVAGRMAKAGYGSPSKMYCTVSSPWYASQTRIIKYEKNEQFIFTHKLADSLVQKEISIFEKEYKSEYVHGGKVVPVELKNMKTVLNGYATPDPVGQKAKELEMIIYVAICSEPFVKQVTEIMMQNFHRDEVKFSSFAMVSYAVARDMFIKHEDFLLVDIGGEVTDIGMVKRDILSESVTFPMGRNFIIRGVAKALKVTVDEAASLVSLYKDAHASEGASQKLVPIITDLKNTWLKKFQESLANISTDISIPATIFITVDQDLAVFFSETIKTEQFTQYTLTDSKFSIIFLNAETLHGAAKLETNIFRDPFLILESIYINRFLR